MVNYVNLNGLVLLAESPKYLELFNIDPSTIFLTLFNTGVLMFLYWKFLHSKVQAILEKRKEAVNAELEAASAAKDKAAAAEKEYLALLADSKAKATKIITAANARAREQEDEIITEAKDAAVKIRQKAVDDIERERKRAVNEIKDQITEIVIMAAGAVAEKEISEADNAVIIESFLVNAGD
ncbi:MAG: F0F1 ATP synthase subunit B [Oscillospiraceae bacterium]|nr:F0F1 ATP synthase subunit B [Oscillospiraceae bacterium]